MANVCTVQVLLCNKSVSRGRYTAELLRSFPTVDLVASIQDDNEIRIALDTLEFDVCIFGPSAIEKKFPIDPLAPGVDYPVRKYVILSVHNTTERVWLAHQYGMNDIIDIGRHLTKLDERLHDVMTGKVDLATITSITQIVDWLGYENIARYAHDELDISIMMELLEGRTNEEIANSVHLAVQTVRNRISRLMKAAGVSNRTQLATKLVR